MPPPDLPRRQDVGRCGGPSSRPHECAQFPVDRVAPVAYRQRALAERRFAALGDFARCVRAWGNLVANGRLASPREWVGVDLHFQDGTSPFVFRETVRSEATTDDPAVIVIQFRLAFLGSNQFLHAAFRRECILHTPLFAGFPGFRSKLWADDVQTGVYSGIYEWQGADAASHYAERMVGLLTPFSNPATARYHVIEHHRRNDFLSNRREAGDGGSRAWWQLSEVPAMSPAPHQ
jgi:hypothetical protein